MAMLLAVALTELLLHASVAFLGADLKLHYLHPLQLAAITAAALGVGTLAGAYPAFILSAFRPAAVFQGAGPLPHASGRARQGLVLLQFAVLISLMLVTGVVVLQTRFGLRQGLRFNHDRLLGLYVPADGCERSPFYQCGACAARRDRNRLRYGVPEQFRDAAVPRARRAMKSHCRMAMSARPVRGCWT